MRAHRFDANPIIRPEMLRRKDGRNINGPSLIRVPEWIESPLATYYLYFAHHGGKYIRMAYADRLEGPWQVHAPGTLRLRDARAARDHVASPDVHVDDERKSIRMYFHAPAAGGQRSFVATSPDGLAFSPSDEVLGSFYFRAFEWRGRWYAVAKGGELYRSADGLGSFEPAPNPLFGGSDDDPDHNAPGSVRHVAVQLAEDSAWIYYTRIGDAPERILRVRVDLTDEWHRWRPAGAPQEVLRPTEDYEGAREPVEPSRPGAVAEAENAVRDPAIFTEDGRTYVVYSVAGESGLAIAELTDADGAPRRRPPAATG